VRRILILDDARGVREFLATVLTSAGYEVFTAESGKGAGGTVATNSIDLVLTDLSMPDEEGIETIRTLRRSYPKLKIIAMSGFFGPDMLDAARVLGANATLAKPVSPEVLRNTIRDVLGA
jgi:CheY-like chemotaxis protein